MVVTLFRASKSPTASALQQTARDSQPQPFVSGNVSTGACYSERVTSYSTDAHFQLWRPRTTCGYHHDLLKYCPMFVCMESFCEGQPADQVVEKGIQPQNEVLQEVGQQLANLHSISVDRGTSERPLRTYEQGGANFVNDHMQGVILSKMKGSEHALAHPFFKFYEVQLKELQSAMLEARTLNVPVGVVHGDPFLDNCLVQSSGESFWVVSCSAVY